MGNTKKSKSSAAKAMKDTTKKMKEAKAQPKGAAVTSELAKATVEARLLRGLPPLTNAQRAAFRKQFSAAQCDDRGGRTKSEGVLKEAREHAGVIAKALANHTTALRRYSPMRFAWLLECVAALDEAREAQRVAEGSSSAAKARLQRASAIASEARADLLDALGVMAAGNASDEHALASKLGSTKDVKGLVQSLHDLAALARSWLSRTDEESRVLAASVSLEGADVDAAELAAETLESASGDKTIEGRVQVRDTPPVNQAEGRVLLELRLAMQVFAGKRTRQTRASSFAWPRHASSDRRARHVCCYTSRRARAGGARCAVPQERRQRLTRRGLPPSRPVPAHDRTSRMACDSLRAAGN